MKRRVFHNELMKILTSLQQKLVKYSILTPLLSFLKACRKEYLSKNFRMSFWKNKGLFRRHPKESNEINTPCELKFFTSYVRDKNTDKRFQRPGNITKRLHNFWMDESIPPASIDVLEPTQSVQANWATNKNQNIISLIM